MEVKIGIQHASRELVVDTEDDAAAVEKQFTEAVAGDGVLALTDTRGRRVIVPADRDALTALLAGGVDRPGMDLAALGRMFNRLTERHAERMTELGLSA